ncbi:MAG: hypothetical protein ACFNM6_07075, partial [Prevotella sp.]
ILVGILKQITTLGAFAVVLWNLSGVLEIPFGGATFHIYGYMLRCIRSGTDKLYFFDTPVAVLLP